MDTELATTENMGELLAVLFIAGIMLISGLILAFTTQDTPRKFGMAVAITGLIVILLCIIFYPSSDRYHL